MTQNDVDKLNEGISYPEGKIFWINGHGWSSKLWQSLWADGWRSFKSPAGIYSAKDSVGNIISQGYLSMAGMLADIAR